MYNHSVNKLRAPDPNGDSSYDFVDQTWAKFGFNTPNASSTDPSQSSYASRPSFNSSLEMDWDPTPSAIQTSNFEQQAINPEDVQYENMSPPPQAGRGVGRLVAHFENKGFAPPLPPRPSTEVQMSQMSQMNQMNQMSQMNQMNQMNHINTSQEISSPFGSFSVAAPSVHSPLASPNESGYGFMTDLSRVASPIASPPPMSFGGFYDPSRVSSPVVNSSGPFGSMDSFAMDNRVASPMTTAQMLPSPMVTSSMVASPSPATPGVPGTPGYAIWRPPVPMTPKPVMDQSQNNNSGGYLKPPVPSTPKPVMNAGSQLILDFNANQKAKGKAPVRPPKQPARRPSTQQLLNPTPPVFSPPSQPDTHTPQPSSSSSAVPASRRGSTSVRSQIGSRPSREQVPAEAWESLKGTIRSLYLEERKPLKEVMSIMADKYGFQATPKMYKTRFSQWGFVKNNTEDEVKRLLSMKFQRDAEGKVSEFVRNGRVVNLGTYLKRKGVTEYDLVDFELPADLPSHIRCRTPTPPPGPGYLRSPDLLRAQETVVGNVRKAFLHCRQSEVESNTQITWQSIMIWGAGSSDMLLEANHFFEMKDADQGGHFLMRAFKQLEEDLLTLSPQGIKELLLGMVNRDPGMMTALCKYLAAYSSTNLERSHPLRQIFTCLYEVQQKHGSVTLSELLWASIPLIAEELETIYGRRHPYVARTWIDLALFYNHVNPERLEKMVGELRQLQRQAEQRQGTDGTDILALRYAILQAMYSASPQSEGTRTLAVDFWNHIRRLGLVFPIRDSRPNIYCYHSPVKVDPWTKRCRRRYDSGVQALEEHVGVILRPYFEEDFHMTEHAPEPQDSWAAAMQQQAAPGKWAYI